MTPLSSRRQWMAQTLGLAGSGLATVCPPARAAAAATATATAATIPATEAFRPLNEGDCPLVAKK